MSDEIINFLEEKIKNPRGDLEKNLDQATLNLYINGNIDAKIENGELLVSITEKGQSSFLANFSHGMKPAEA